MKKIFSIYVFTTVGAIFGNLLYVHTLGDLSDYHWTRIFVFAFFLATIFALLRKHRDSSR